MIQRIHPIKIRNAMSWEISRILMLTGSLMASILYIVTKNGHHQRLATYNPMMIHLLYKTLCFLHLRFFIQMQSPFAQLWMDAYGNLMMEIR